MPKARAGLVKLWHRASLGLMLVAVLSIVASMPVFADNVTSRGVQLNSSYPSATTTYKFFFTINTASTIGSYVILLCSNSPLQEDSCTIPSGLDVTQEHIVATEGIHPLSVYPVTTNELLVSFVSVPVSPPLKVSLTLSGIVNPDTVGSYYGRISTYASSNGTGPVIDFGGLAFVIMTNLEVSSYVPPYLTFCAGLRIPAYDCGTATGNYINFGDLAASHSSQGSSQMLLATNASGGYVIQVYGTTMTSGNNIIRALSGNSGSHPGSPQFGINLRANSTPHIGANPTGPGSGQPASGYDTPNSFRFVSDDIVASSLVADNYRKYTVSYLVNVPADQAPGVYVSTLTYVGTGSF